MRVKPGVIGLRDPDGADPSRLPQDGDFVVEADDVAAVTQVATSATESCEETRVHVPLFPAYGQVRHLLRVWPGHLKKQVTGLQSTVQSLRGTPQNTVDWTDPAAWIPERLDGEDRELAQFIWEGSGAEVNPRHTYGHWLLAQRYGLVEEDAGGVLRITPAGEDFLENPVGDAVARGDEAEGLLKLLSLVADNGPARPAALFDEWGDYLRRRSACGTESTIKDTMRRRLANLLEQGLVERKSASYSATAAGLEYLRGTGDEDSVGSPDQNGIWDLVRKQESAARESLHELLLDMDPFAFEHLVKRLLEEMDYQNVEITSRSGDGGVDVVADIELGITSVREVVQAKRHRRPVERKDLDALRGSLYRLNAV